MLSFDLGKVGVTKQNEGPNKKHRRLQTNKTKPQKTKRRPKRKGGPLQEQIISSRTPDDAIRQPYCLMRGAKTIINGMMYIVRCGSATAVHSRS